MILQVRTHLARIDEDRDAVTRQVLGGSDAAQHEQLRSVHRAPGEDDFAASERLTGDAVDLDVDAGRARHGGAIARAFRVERHPAARAPA